MSRTAAIRQQNMLTRAGSAGGKPERNEGGKAASVVADLDILASLLDSRWRIPGTSIRFGLDALVGLVPVVGDAATGIVSAYIVWRARSCGAGNVLVARMLGNVLLDTIAGSVPILGSIFDVYFKPNNRNIRLLRRYLGKAEVGGRPAKCPAAQRA
ncbi:DUF4112 domain-containing protein [Mesorhizobium sp. M4B.F.Ca.ET.190.01.1.1]|nr:DUF4112 domain-containing protein [Mesorhizobium sp. M4B.F.Ca.ET.013.02.1.1]RVD41158.1 DUF4112 domain-containing protein [Mesorhizobium sp. M4B.F.Ca.ET.019.03.1.1]RWF61077.1 MAG: DUF4112 domain-containing protein [Mesorhizobium sp.]TGQ27560.1 DUF4112 domain-containing protein [Mesorhizobium sp. M4B.F.Ca.ET.214.01.1.1]TGQ54600.1 DUF4112 domain-containing protein [Mesorhizobium sp. M4B.F.Ca.ET.211.01.1.1]TGQ99041.1 DUF4112 domain-containing protein [Mesorhizobium sp. M4B.F.Ca.ET.200.01.1.1]T